MNEPTAPKMRRCFKSGGGFAVWVPDVPEPEPVAEAASEPAAPAETAPADDEEEVPPEGDCDGCSRKPSNQPPSVP